MRDDGMSEERLDELIAQLADDYNAPPETPREEIWAALEAELRVRDGRRGAVIPIDRGRPAGAQGFHRVAGWAVAAAALLVLGVGIGRMTAPVGSAEGNQALAVSPAERASLVHVATVEHLGRSESLLTLVRADASTGRVDPHVRRLARDLLTETRLLLDTPQDQKGDPEMRSLLEDLELVLVQVVGAEDSEVDGKRDAGTELRLALQGMDERAVLPRIQAAMPSGPGLPGT